MPNTVKSPKTYLILLLALTTVGGAALAWHQYAELIELRAAAMNKDERANLQKRLWDFEKLNRQLQDQIAALRGENGRELDGSVVAGTDDQAADRRARGGPGGRGGPPGRGDNGQQQINALRELMTKPEVQAMLNVQQKAGIDARYAALFKNLNLPPEQLDKLKNLLAERQTTMQDVMTAARDQGLDPRRDPEGFRKLMTDAQNDINSSIKSAIGDAGFAQLQTYEQTLPQRNLVNDLQQRLSYTNTPLTSTQADQLVQILAANTPARQPANGTQGQPQPPQGERGQGGPGGGFGGGGGGFGGPGGPRGGDIGGLVLGALGGGGPGGGLIAAAIDGGGRGGGTVPVTSAAIMQAQTVLAPPQLAALQQIQQQQQTQQQLQQLVRETINANQPAGNPRGPAPGNGGGGPNRRPGGGG